jgi:multiple sugar transport system ATP-binding protein
MADKIVVLNAGRIKQVGSPMELYRNPATPFVAGFIGSPRMNLYTGDAAREMRCGTYGIRPEHLTLSRDGGTWQGRVRHMERLGADAILFVAVDGLGDLVVRTDGETDFVPGDTVHATPMEGREHRFP